MGIKDATPKGNQERWLKELLQRRVATQNAMQPSLSDFAQLISRGRRARRDGKPSFDDVTYYVAENFGKFVLFDDPDFAVLYKPPGIITSRSHNNDSRDLIGLEEIAKFRLGIQVNMAHRLDRYTSGAIVLAKTPEALFDLSLQFGHKEAGGVQKLYLALLDGEFSDPFNPTEVAVSIRPDPKNRKRMEVAAVDTLGSDVKSSLTYFRPLVLYETPDGDRKTLTAVEIVTGRTHQIRVVSSQALGMPVMGDYYYNPRGTQDADRPMLHAWRIQFRHPKTDDPVMVEAPVARDFLDLLATYTPLQRYSGK
jgi:23S rRNA pseudouridine1911/1915/1917 synthase